MDAPCFCFQVSSKPAKLACAHPQRDLTNYRGCVAHLGFLLAFHHNIPVQGKRARSQYSADAAVLRYTRKRSARGGDAWKREVRCGMGSVAACERGLGMNIMAAVTAPCTAKSAPFRFSWSSAVSNQGALAIGFKSGIQSDSSICTVACPIMIPSSSSPPTGAGRPILASVIYRTSWRFPSRPACHSGPSAREHG